MKYHHQSESGIKQTKSDRSELQGIDNMSNYTTSIRLHKT